jgi:hypothetical protein
MSHPKKPIPKEAMKSTKPLPLESHPTPQPKPPVTKKPQEKTKIDKQMVSKYEEKTKPKARLALILLIIFLIIAISMVIGVFLFKDELIDFLSNLF